jgi:hypothetical protein
VRNRFLGSMIALAAVVVVLSLAPVPAAGPTSLVSFVGIAEASGGGAQAPAAAKTWTPPRTLDGQPDIQGVWNNGMGGQYDVEGILGEVNDLLNVPADPFIIPRVRTQPDQSLVVDPADGKIPYQPWAAAKRREHLVNLFTPTKREQVDPDDRCFLNGAPRQVYGGGFQIMQIPGYVLFLFENSHAYRIIPMDSRPHLGKNIKLWMGDSRGHWEGDTLVVEVTNQNDMTWLDSHGTFHSDAVHVVERFTPVNADTIRYEATITDPTVFTRPWKIALPLNRNKEAGELWEEACHEGEQSVEHMISAGRLAREAGKTGIHTHDLER